MENGSFLDRSQAVPVFLATCVCFTLDVRALALLFHRLPVRASLFTVLPIYAYLWLSPVHSVSVLICLSVCACTYLCVCFCLYQCVKERESELCWKEIAVFLHVRPGIWSGKGAKEEDEDEESPAVSVELRQPSHFETATHITQATHKVTTHAYTWIIVWRLLGEPVVVCCDLVKDPDTRPSLTQWGSDSRCWYFLTELVRVFMFDFYFRYPRFSFFFFLIVSAE